MCRNLSNASSNNRAVDQGSPQLHSEEYVRIRITDDNDGIPIFNTTSYTGSVHENAPPGTFVLTVRATDPVSQKSTLPFREHQIIRSNRFIERPKRPSPVFMSPSKPDSEETKVILVRR